MTAQDFAEQPRRRPAWPAMSIEQAHALLTAPGMPFEMDEVDLGGARTRVWKHAPATLCEVVLAGRAHGDQVFLVHEDERVTFETFFRAVAAFAHQLRADGVEKGDRVAIVMRNLPEWPVAFFATVAIGAIAAPLNAWWAGAELAYGLADADPKVLVADAERSARIAEHGQVSPALRRVYVVRTGEAVAPPLARRLETVLGADWTRLPDRPLPDVALQPEDEATIFYTSGTTGHPKGALATHRNIASTVMASALSAARACLRRGEQPPARDSARRAVLLSVPLFHVTGCFARLTPALFGGAKLCLMRKFEPEVAMALIERERCTAVGDVPTVVWQLLAHPARERYDLSSLATVSYGGAPSAPELARRVKDAWPEAQPGNGWGMTETSATFTHHMAEDYLHRPDSCGPALPVCDMKVVGPDGATLGPDQVGELWVKGPNVVKGYWRQPEATAQSFVEGWLRTGDLARIDADGFCVIVDRIKDMLIRGGENIYCIEIENILHDHPAVLEAGVVGLPHPSLGEEPAAIVRLKAGARATAAELKAHVAGRLAAFKVPVRILIRSEALPRNVNGKLMKSALKTFFP